MIENETEYREAVRRIGEEAERLKQYEQELVERGLSPDKVKRAMDPLRSFHEQRKEEVQDFERRGG